MEQPIFYLFYVAKVYGNINPSIVESFIEKEDALEYAKIMNRAGKGTYVVLRIEEE